MKKLIACLLLFLMTAALVPAAAAADMPILHTPVNPTNDGVITEEEWGEPDAVVEYSDSSRPDKIEYWWRYTSTTLYFAVRVHTQNFKNGAHDAGGSYLIPRIQQQQGGTATYMGLISMTEDNKLFEAHLGSVANRPCGARVVGDTFEMEFAFPIYVFSRGEDEDCLSIQLDYHEPKEITNSLPVMLIFSGDDAELPAPAETEPPVTDAPETDPPVSDAPDGTETAPAEPPADTSDSAGATGEPADEEKSPAVAIAAIAAIAVITVALLAVLFGRRKTQ